MSVPKIDIDKLESVFSIMDIAGVKYGLGAKVPYLDIDPTKITFVHCFYPTWLQWLWACWSCVVHHQVESGRCARYDGVAQRSGNQFSSLGYSYPQATGLFLL